MSSCKQNIGDFDGLGASDAVASVKRFEHVVGGSTQPNARISGCDFRSDISDEGKSEAVKRHVTEEVNFPKNERKPSKSKQHRIIMVRPLPDPIDFTRPQELYRQTKQNSDADSTSDTTTCDVTTKPDTTNDSVSTSMKPTKHRIYMVKPLQNTIDLTKPQEIFRKTKETKETDNGDTKHNDKTSCDKASDTQPNKTELQRSNIETLENDSKAINDLQIVDVEDTSPTDSTAKDLMSLTEQEKAAADRQHSNKREPNEHQTTGHGTPTIQGQKTSRRKPTEPDYQVKIDEVNKEMTTTTDLSFSRPKKRIRGPRAHILKIQQSFLFDIVGGTDSQELEKQKKETDKKRNNFLKNINKDKFGPTVPITDLRNDLGQPIKAAFTEQQRQRLSTFQYIRKQVNRFGIFIRKRISNLCCGTRVTVIQTMK